MESKKSLQKDAPETFRGTEVAEAQTGKIEVRKGASVLAGTSFRSFSPSAPSVAPSTNEEMLTPSREQSPPGHGKKLVEC